MSLWAKRLAAEEMQAAEVPGAAEMHVMTWRCWYWCSQCVRQVVQTVMPCSHASALNGSSTVSSMHKGRAKKA